MYHDLLIIKWLMIFVLPGVEEVFASLSLLQIMLMSEDLPTLLRPINAYSGLSGAGQVSTEGLDITYSASFIIMLQSNRKAFRA